MTAGDPIVDHQFIPTEGEIVIQPPVGEIWMIKNIYFGGAWELYRLQKETKTPILIGFGLNSGMWKNRTIILSNDIILSIRNISETSNGFGYDGLVIK